MNRMVLFSAVLLFGVFISAVSQVLLKKAAVKHYDSWIREYLNPRVIIAYVMFLAATLLSVFAYKVIPLSLGPILEATSYIYVTIFSVMIFHEKIGRKKLIALVLIFVGIIIYALFG